jgi:hypothetical protein
MRPAPPNDDLSAWLDGELTEDRAAELEAELQRDPALRAELEELEAVVRLVRDAGPRPAPSGFAHRVMARIDQEEAKSARSAWAWLRRPWGIPLEGWALGLAAAAAILLLLPIGKGPGEPAPEEAPREVSPAALDTRPTPRVVADPVAPPPTAEPSPAEEKAVEKGLERGTAPEPVAKTTPSGEERPGTADPGLGTAVGIGTSIPPASKGAVGTEPMPAPAPAPTGTSTATDTYAVDLPQAPGRVVLQGDDPKMKRQILSLAARYGGAQQDGRPVTSAKMAAERESVVVWLPQSDLSGFTKQIEALGYPMTVENTGELVAGQSVPLRIDLEPLPDAEPKQAAPSAVDAPNAAEQTAE